MKKTILLATCALATLSAAAAAPDAFDMAAEVAVLGQIERAVDVHMREMRAHAAGVAAGIRTEMDERFRDEKMAITAERDGVYAELQRLRGEMGELDRYELERRIRADFNKKEEAGLAPLFADLKAARAPVMDQVRQLAGERNEIERIHYENKRRYARLMDGLDSLGAGMRMASKDEAINALLASVEGDLPKQIDEVRSALMKEMYYVMRDAEKRAEARRQELKAIMYDFTMREKGLEGRLREIAQATEHAVDAAMPGKHAMFAAIREELLLEVLSGHIDRKSFVAAAGAA